MVKFFINRPIFATVVALIIIIIGIISLRGLPVAQYPQITPPTIQVSATYPGADAQTVAQSVGEPIELQVNGVEGMMYMSSTSSSSGTYDLMITFELGTDLDMASVMVQNRVALAQSVLPEAVVVQGVVTRKQSSNMVMILSLTSQDSLYDALYLSNYATLQMLDELTRLPGVGSVTVMGAGNYNMRIWLNPEKMRLRNITPQEVYAAISQQSTQVSAGYVGQPLMVADNPFQYTLNVQGQLVTPEQFGDIILRVDSVNRFLRLRDVARVELGSESYSMVSKLDSKPSASIAIYQLPGSNSVDVAKEIEAKLVSMREALPDGVNLDVTLNSTLVIDASIHEVLITFIETVLLVILVILLFLQSFRAVIIPCISIPVSLIGTFLFMNLLGFSVNTLTLFGLILAIAIVVDDAIVVVENSSRLLETNQYTPRQAVKKAMGEIVGPIVGIVIVLLAVFVPTAFISGISGQLYKQFALTISAATLISGFNSLTLTPALCALFLRIPKGEKFILYRWFDVFINGAQRVYNSTVLFLLKKAWLAAIIYVVLAVIAIVLYMKWPTTFLPTEDEGYFMISTQLPPAASLNRTMAVNTTIDSIIRGYPEVKTYVSMAGFSLMAGGEASNVTTYFVILKDWSERKKKSESASAVVKRFNEAAYGIQEADIFAMVPPSIPGLGAYGGLTLELQDVNSLGFDALADAVKKLKTASAGNPEIIELSSMYQANVPQYQLNFDRDKIQMLGIDVNDVFVALSYFMGSAYVNNFVEFGRNYHVTIQASEDAQISLKDVLKLTVSNNHHQMVPFSSFTTIDEKLGLDNITMYNMFPTATILCIGNPFYSSEQVMQTMESMVETELNGNFGYEWTSVAYQEQQSGSTAVIVLLMSLLIAYLVLSAQYESWTSPLAALLGIPIALLGAMIGCLVMKVAVSIYTQIGIILLVALATKNGILIVEFARDFRKEGNSIREAAVEAGHVRLRPILMTSFAFVFGVMPLLFATGAGANSRIALGAAVVFGMAINTLIGTLFIPCFYEWFQTLQEKVLDRINKKEDRDDDATVDKIPPSV